MWGTHFQQSCSLHVCRFGEGGFFCGYFGGSGFLCERFSGSGFLCGRFGGSGFLCGRIGRSGFLFGRSFVGVGVSQVFCLFYYYVNGCFGRTVLSDYFNALRTYFILT